MLRLNIFLTLSCLFLSVTGNCKNGKPTKINEFTINLDLEPSLRLIKFLNFIFHRLNLFNIDFKKLQASIKMELDK